MSNANLNRAKKAKNDEFYTQYNDIEKEVKYYVLKNKYVYCNCDDDKDLSVNGKCPYFRILIRRKV